MYQPAGDVPVQCHHQQEGSTAAGGATRTPGTVCMAAPRYAGVGTFYRRGVGGGVWVGILQTSSNKNLLFNIMLFFQDAYLYWDLYYLIWKLCHFPHILRTQLASFLWIKACRHMLRLPWKAIWQKVNR